MAVDLLNGDIVEFRFITTNAEQTAMNVRHYLVAAAPVNGVPLAQVLPLVSTTFAPHFKGLMPAAARYEGLGGRKVSPLPISIEEFTSQGSGVGTVAEDLMARQVAGLIQLRTNTAGRKGRGRLYIPFPGEFHNDAQGKPTAAYNTLAENFADALEIGLQLTPAAGNLTLWPQVYNRATRTGTTVQSANAAGKWATQRRRGSFGRPNSNPIPTGA